VPSSPDRVPPAAAGGLEIRPFRALTYRRRDPGHLARVSSPAYDLVTPQGRDRLAGADPHNIVRLILPRVEAPSGGNDPARASAEAAGAALRRWTAEGVLEREPAAALWVYELDPPDATPATVGWLGAVALPTGGSAAVLPHEDTFAGAVEGRRALLAATGTDLEPIVLAHDVDPGVTALTDEARRGVPTMEVEDSDGVSHRLWRVTDPATLVALAAALRRTGAVIADGHHRFAAARANARAHPPAAGSDAVLALVTPMGTGGLRVAPIHRVVPDLSLEAAVAAAADGFQVAELPLDGPGGPVGVAEGWVAAGMQGGHSFLVTDGRRVAELSSPSAAALATVPAEAPPAWRGLDVVLAHAALLGGSWGRRADDPDAVLIAHDVDEALRTAEQRSGVALLLRAPSPADVAAVARAGARMPRKSTLFVPKPRTGLVMRPLGD
jgi:uncharacterized protein (DUF1015 family)